MSEYYYGLYFVKKVDAIKTSPVKLYNGLRPGSLPYGDGSKVATDELVLVDGSKRWRRMYTSQASRTGSRYVIIDKQKTYVESSKIKSALKRKGAKKC